MTRGVARANVRLVTVLLDAEETLAILHEEALRNWVVCFRGEAELPVGDSFHDVGCGAHVSVFQRVLHDLQDAVETRAGRRVADFFDVQDFVDHSL